MKKDNLKFLSALVIAIMQLTFTATGQVKSIGIAIDQRGYIEAILSAKNQIIVDFISDNAIETQTLRVDSRATIKNPKGEKIDFSKLRCGTQVRIQGDYFKSGDSSVANMITTIVPKDKSRSIKGGRLDFVKGDFAYVDGSKIMLGKGAQVKGINGYKGKSFKSFNSLVLGDLMNVECTYDNAGYFLVSKAEIEPDLQTELDVKATTSPLHDALVTLWNNETERNKLLGTYVPNIGWITDSKVLQDYVTRIGMSLIPAQFRDKTKVIFIVITNDQWNANMQQNGICRVYTGLLKTMQNEAQLAAVLGHEITHGYYEHIAKQIKDESNAESKKRTANKLGGFINSVVAKVNPTVTVFNSNKKVIESTKIDSSTTNAIFKKLPAALADKQLSDFSVDDEEQSDRVGLSLMVNAGYDPREAPIVWRDSYNRSSQFSDEQAKGGSSVLTSAVNGMSGKKDPNAFSFGGSLINQVFNKNIDKLKTKSQATHPKNIERFEALNQLIDLNYSEEGLLQSLKTNEALWVSTLTTAEKELDYDKFEYLYASTDDIKERLDILNYGISKGFTPLYELYKKRAICNYALKNVKEALADCNKAITMKSNDDYLYYLRGLIKNRSGKSLEALTDLNKAIALNANDEEYFYEKGRCYYNLNKYKEASLEYSKSVKLNTAFSSGFFGRGLCNYKLLKYNEAISDFEQVLSIDPDDSAAQNNLELCKNLQAKKQAGNIKIIVLE